MKINCICRSLSRFCVQKERELPTDQNRQKFSSCHFPFLIAVIFAAAAFLCAACGSEKKASTPPPPVVTVLEVIQRDVPVVYENVAQTQSSHLVNIQARVSGFLDRRLYVEGAVVKQGQVLFQMDPKPFQVQLAQAKAALKRQQAALETARLTLARTKPLAEQSALSQKNLDDARGRFESEAAAVEQAKAQVETAKLNLSYTTISSPIAGITSSARQTDGTYISPQNSLLTTVATLSPIWVTFSLSENEIQKYRDSIAKGQLLVPKAERFVVEVVLVDGSIHPYTGQVTFAEPSFNQQTGTFAIRASVNNPQGVLRPNQFVRVRLKGAIRPKAILVPQKAVQQGSKGHFLWVLGTGNKVEQRPVTVGDWHGEDWFILEGLRNGERVVTDGIVALRPGMQVTVKANNPAPAAVPQAAPDRK